MAAGMASAANQFLTFVQLDVEVSDLFVSALKFFSRA